jgi:hypothetical protein
VTLWCSSLLFSIPCVFWKRGSGSKGIMDSHLTFLELVCNRWCIPITVSPQETDP